MFITTRSNPHAIHRPQGQKRQGDLRGDIVGEYHDEVFWYAEKAKWGIRNDNHDPHDELAYFAPLIEVIGNIYENPKMTGIA